MTRTLEQGCHISIDGGGTTLGVAAFDIHGGLDPLETLTVPSTNNYAHDMRALIDACKALAAKFGPIQDMGIGLAGNVDLDTQQLRSAGNLTDWVDKPITPDLQSELSCRSIILRGDGFAAAAAEALYGHGAVTTEEFLLMIVGTGVGGAWVTFQDGRPIIKDTELGHSRLGRPKTPRKCGCTRSDCMECWYGGDGLEVRLGRKAETLSRIEAEREIFPHAYDHLYNLLVNHPVPQVLYTGGIAAGQKWMMELLESMLAVDLRIVKAPSVRLSKFGASAGIMGGRALVEYFSHEYAA